MTTPSSEALHDLLDGFFAAQVLMTSTRLKMYTKCADEPHTAEALAHRCDVEPAWMTLLLDANVSLGLLEATADGYRPTALAAVFLNEQKHGAVTNSIKFALADEAPAWVQLSDIVRDRSARPDFDAQQRAESTRARAYGKAVWPDLFRDACSCVEPDGVERAVDIGNGLGPLGLALLKGNSTAQLTVVDWPSYEKPLWKTYKHAGYRERTTFVGGDPTTATPQDGQADLALIGGVLGRTPDTHRLPLLQAAAGALRPGGRIHVQEYLDDGAPTLTAALARLRAAVLFGPEGLSPLSVDELGTLLDAAGFTDVQTQPIPHSEASCVTAHRGTD